jgi:hypothetical protein
MTSSLAVPLEVLQFEEMASGARSLRLTTKVQWEDFPEYARHVVSLLGGIIHDRADSPSERVWSVTIMGGRYWISLDDFALGVSLDPRDSQADRLIQEVRERLLRHRSIQHQGSREGD